MNQDELITIVIFTKTWGEVSSFLVWSLASAFVVFVWLEVLRHAHKIIAVIVRDILSEVLR